MNTFSIEKAGEVDVILNSKMDALCHQGLELVARSSHGEADIGCLSDHFCDNL